MLSYTCNTSREKACDVASNHRAEDDPRYRLRSVRDYGIQRTDDDAHRAEIRKSAQRVRQNHHRLLLHIY